MSGENGILPGGAVRALEWESGLEPLVALDRGGHTEFVYRGVVVCADTAGVVRGAVGRPDTHIHLRSAAKPFQALALVETGAADALGFTSAELALACGSHAGDPEHVAVVEGLLQRLGLPRAALVCGGVAHMCSGKHAAMVALAVFLGVPVDGYHLPEHEVQRVVARHAAVAAGLEPGDIMGGSDGCGVPVFRMPAQVVATLYARLMEGGTPAFARIREAMLSHPRLVAGVGRFDTEIMQAGSGRVLAKVGAGGVQALAYRSDDANGVCACVVKLAGEPGPVVAGLVAAEAMRRWGPTGPVVPLVAGDYLKVHNARGDEVGEVYALF